MRMSRRMCLMGSSAVEYTYTGTSAFSGDPAGDWKLTLKTSGTLTFQKLHTQVDIFVVGGGAGGAKTDNNEYTSLGGNGGAGGKTNLGTKTLTAGVGYTVTIGGGSAGTRVESTSTGGTTSVKNGSTNILSADGGSSYGWAYSQNTGSGGSGGGAGGTASGTQRGYAGGSDGANGGYATSGKVQTGMGTSGYLVREFRESGGTKYAGGGGGGACSDASASTSGAGGAGGGGRGGYKGGNGVAGTANTGGGGGGAGSSGVNKNTTTGGTGGSGVVIIRNKRS